VMASQRLTFGADQEVRPQGLPNSSSNKGDPNGAEGSSSNRKRRPRKRRGNKSKNKELKERMQKYERGLDRTDESKPKLETKEIRDKKLKRNLFANEKVVSRAAEHTARAEILMTQDAGYLEAEGMEKTWRFKQDQLKKEVDVRTKQKMFSLDLDKFGPYALDFTLDGRYMLLGGRKGHISLMEWQKFKLETEFHVQETIRDVAFLHNQAMYAVAQKKYTYIYDNDGLELHCLRNHSDVNKLAFLPYHFLMVTVGMTGWLKYQDVSTGTIIAQHRTKLGQCHVMAQNPANAVMCLGHKNGTVTLWSPSITQPLVKMLCHRGPLRALAVSRDGKHMATSALDGRVKIWDLRNYKELHSYFSIRPAASLDISQKGMLALGCGSHVQIWKDAFQTKQKDPYMVHEMPGHTISRVKFCPYEDILGVSSSKGFQSVVVPGAGEPNFDSFEHNLFATRKQARERLVNRLLEKLPPEMISLDSDLVGSVDEAPLAVKQAERLEEAKRRKAEELANKKEKNKARGRNTAGKRWRRKRGNVMDERTAQRREKIAKIHNARKLAREDSKRKEKGMAKDALARFKML